MTTTFAGFNYPKFLADLPPAPLAKRLAIFKENKRKPSLNGYRQNDPAPLEKQDERGRMFYLNSDLAPGLRFEYADKVDGSRINHTGWFTNEFDDGDTIRGIVFRLPRNRGFLAGWTMGDSMASELEYRIFDDQVRAARAADSLAEDLAEDMRQRDYETLCHTCYEHLDDPLPLNDEDIPTCQDCLDKEPFKEIEAAKDLLLAEGYTVYNDGALV